MRGYDGSKKLTGRRRHLLVDSRGLVLKVVVLAGNLTDRDGGKLLLEPIGELFPHLQHVFVDVGYKG